MKSLEYLSTSRCKDYSVSYLRGVLEAERLSEAEDYLISHVISLVRTLLDDAYISTAGSDCLSEWERIFDLSSDASQSMDDRRQAIIDNMLAHNVMNEAYFRARIKALLSGISHEVHLFAAGPSLMIRTWDAEVGDDGIEPVIKVIHEIKKDVPCNLQLIARTINRTNGTAYIGAGSVVYLYTKVITGE